MAKPLLITSGEPAGVGPDVILQFAQDPYVVIADPFLLKKRAAQLKLPIQLILVDNPKKAAKTEAGMLNIFPLVFPKPVIAGKLCVENAGMIIPMLNLASNMCQDNEVAAVITLPVQKSILNEAGFDFIGHTHYFAKKCQISDVTMFFVSPSLRLALVTDHVPLKKVSENITQARLENTIRQTHDALQYYFGIPSPRLTICGLNPHAGENGYLGDEEIKIITPVIEALSKKHYQLTGPISADSAFTAERLKNNDAIIAMYHDQGLTALKQISFGQAVNITLGLPFLRTSVDHGTALDLAGTGKASAESLNYAVKITREMLQHAALSS